MINESDIPPVVGIPIAVPFTGELNFEGGLKIIISPTQVTVLHDPTCRVTFDSGPGPRENTRDLRSCYTFTPRPASGTRMLSDRAAAPTQLGLEGENMKNIMKQTLAVVFLILTAVAAMAQDNKVTGIGAFQNLNVANQNLPGANASAEYTIGKYSKFHVSAVADGSFSYDTNEALDRYQFLGGSKLSYKVGERVSVFGRGLFGVTRFDQQNPKLKDFTRGTVSVGGGIDVHYGKFVFRPGFVDLQWIDERPVRYTRAGVGFGIKLF